MYKEKYTNFTFWNSLPFTEKGQEYFPLLYRKCTGLLLEPDWKIPPGIVSLQRQDLCYMKKAGFRPDIILNNGWRNTHITIPLYSKNQIVEGFLTAYKLISNKKDLKWIKYTLQPDVDEKTSLVAISGQAGITAIGMIVDTPKDFLKLVNWYHCQPKYFSLKKNYVVIYLDQGEDDAIGVLRSNYLRFKTLIDLTHTGVLEQVKKYYTNKTGELSPTYLKNFIYFETNPLSFADSKELLEKVIQYVGQKL